MNNRLNIRILDNSNYGSQGNLTPQFVKYKANEDDFYPIYENEDKLTIPNKLFNLNNEMKKIKCINDVIKLCETPINHFEPCNHADLFRLQKIMEPLKELDKMIGMKEIKMKMLYHSLFYCQDLHKIAINHNIDSEGDLMNVVIQGDPGSGKTTIAKLIGKIYLKLGILKNNKFISASRKDLIAEYLGQTTIKTTKVLESALGGVLFIDEAYSLGNTEKRDIYSKECIDTINQFLTEHKRELIVIVAGYKENLKSCFFDVNPGLQRRFPWVYTIDNYDNNELRQILIKQVLDSGWGFKNNNPTQVIPLDFIENNRKLFNFIGGDTETFVAKCQMAHSLNTFGMSNNHKGKLSSEDIIKGLEIYKNTRQNYNHEDDDTAFSKNQFYC